MDLIIELGRPVDASELGQLYDDLNDHLARNINYPGWIKGIYPIRENASDAIARQCLYVARYRDSIVGSIILNHEPEQAYEKVKWEGGTDYSKVFVIYTFVVHPGYLYNGIGRRLMEFALDHGRSLGMESIRLDVYEKNLPAIKLYEKCGFRYIDTVDLGLRQYGLDWFKLYERIL
jgi:GNAT superfamily N-acetyltransferase